MKTLMYVYKITPWDLLEETIVVDDESGDPIDPLIESAVNNGELSFLTGLWVGKTLTYF